MKRKFTFLLMALLTLVGFKSWGQETLTVCDGTVQEQIVPVFINYFDTQGTISQYVIPSADITAMNGCDIKAMKFYISNTPWDLEGVLSSAKVTCKLQEVGSAVVSSIQSGGTTVFSGNLTTANQELDCVFDTPYAYQGGNLLISFEVIQKGNCVWTTFYGIDPGYNSAITNKDVYENNPQPFIPKTTFTYSSCIAPTGLAASNVTATGATISWTGNGAENYDLAYGVASTFNLENPSTYAVQNTTATSVQLSGLTTDTEYKCAVKAHCSDEEESDWSSAVTFMPSAFQHLTVNDGTDVYDKAPFYGDNAYYNKTKSQFVIPASYIEDMQGCEITQLKFYVNSSSSYNPSWSNDSWDVYVKEMDDPSGAWWDFYDFGTMTKVYSGSVSIVDNQLTITLEEPYQYNDKSLMIGFNQTNTGFNGVTHWLGSNNTSGSAGGSRCRAGWQSGNQYETKPFLPKTTFTYTSVSCPAPTGLAASNITAEGATISWNDNGAESYNLDVNGTVYENVTNPYILDVELSTTYTVKVQAVCVEDETSAWSSAINFTTPDCWDEHTINYTLNDSYGDGWNGAYLTIVDSDDNTIETLTLSGKTESGSLTLCSGTYDFVWHKGLYDYECSFSISENGETLFTCNSASDYTNGQVVYTLDLLEKFSIILIHPSEEVGTISADYEQAPAGTTVTLSANPAFGYEFGTWTVMAGEDPVTVTNNTFEMPESDVTVTATFNELTPYNINCAELTEGTIHAEYNGVTISEAPAGTEITLVAEANAGYTLDHFTVDDEPLPGNTFIMPESNVTVSAVFSPVYNISIDMALVGGSISQMSTQGTLTAYPAGTQVFLFANPDEDYSFVENSFIVIRSDGEIGPTVTYTNTVYSFIMPESNVTVSATFNKTAFAVSQVITPMSSGSFTISKTAHVGIGETVTLSYFNANPGYYFDFEDVNSLVVKRNDNQETVEVNNYGNIYQFAMPTSDVTVTATFKELPRYSVFVGDVVNGTITLDNPYQDIWADAIVYFEVEPETGYTLESITVTPEEGNPFEPTQQYDFYYFTMPSSNVTISATFRQLQSYTINYYVNGQLDRTMQCQETHFVNNDGPQYVAVPAGMTFEGWGIAEIDTYVTEKPAVLGNAEYPTQNYNLYAVLRYTESVPAGSKDDKWVKVTSTSDLKANDKIVLVYNSKIMCQRWNESYTNYEQTAVSVVGNEINSLPENAIEFTLVNESDNWKLKYTDWGNDATLSYTSAYQSLVPQGLYGASYDNWIAVQKGSAVIMKNANYDVYIAYSSGQDMIYPLSSNGTACEVFKLDNPVITNTYYMTSVLTDGEVAANTTAKNIIITTGTVTVGNDIVLTMNENGLFRNENAAKFVFKDGAQLITANAGVLATMKKHINGTDWYTISSPLAASVNVTDVTNLIPGNNIAAKTYDLYRLNEAEGIWENARPETDQEPAFTTIDKGCGYIYANNAGADHIAFAGEINVADVKCTLTNEAAHGFNLIGNPFSQNIKLTDVKSDGTAVLADGFYVLNNDETWATEPITTGTIAPLQGFLVQATTAGTATISKPTAALGKGERSEQNTNIEMIVSNSIYRDNAYAVFGEGIGLNKINHRNAEAPMLYVPQDGENFAIAFMDESTTIFPLSFKAMTTGSYSISLKPTDDVSTLVLVDNMTGTDVDLLATPSYTFIGSPRDNENRFTVKFEVSYGQDGDGDEHFAYQNGSELVINGEGTLQIFDILGRVVISEEVHGQTVNVGGLNTGAYIVRLTGESVKTQKIVVR